MNLFKSIKNRKGAIGAIGAISIGILILTLAFALASVSFVKPVLAAHDATITINPNVANCDELGNTFTVNVYNNGPDKILQVEIYKALSGISDFNCGPAPTGWNYLPWPGEDRCIYVTGLDSAYKIATGTSLDFTFDAVMSSDSCDSMFTVVTVDDKRPVGDRKTKDLYVLIDCTDPLLYKDVGDPKIPGAAWDWWVTSKTSLNMFATDNETTDECNLGIDFCRWRVTLDGVEGKWNDVKDGPQLSWVINLLGDSNHHLEVECYDRAGNMVTLVEDDKVDNTPPVTTKTFNGPQKIDPKGVEWIDGITTVTLDPVDPDPTGYQCNIGVDKTWYKNVLWGSEEPCWNPTACQVLAEQMPYCSSCPDKKYPKECMDDVQAYCDGWKKIYDPKCVSWCEDECGGEPGCVEECIDEECSLFYSSWYDCVQKVSNDKCCGGWDWTLYTGTSIPKTEESCHVLYYFSVDNLGNLENIKTNCFFVDKTPPVGTKIVGDPKVEGDGSTFDYWVTQKTPITLDCEDQLPHPAGDEKVCYKVSFDDPTTPWLTEQYCNEFGGNMEKDWCCASVADTILGGTVPPKTVYTFHFMEDSVHDLEYYCIDAVDKKSEVDKEYFKVDTVPPSITKTMIGKDHLGECPPGPSPTEPCYVRDNGENGVHVDVKDGGDICAVDETKCYYELWWKGQIIDSDGFGESGVDIIFKEDSEHILKINCKDALGNAMLEDVEKFLVDSTPPVTTKTYGEPFKVEPQCYDMCVMQCTNSPVDMECVDACIHEHCVWWITSQTPITLTALDEKVGVDKIYWRNLYFPKNDEICYKNVVGEVGVDQIPTYCHPEYYMKYVGDQDLKWNEYDGPFYKPEDSCHVIEYYSVDKLGNEEIMKWQCVFVDNTAPKEIKTVDKPSLPGDGSTFDYWVTQNTPITLDCEDLEPHPVNQETMCYRVSFDDPKTPWLTAKYCEEFGGEMVDEKPIDAKPITVPAGERKGDTYVAPITANIGNGPCSLATRPNQCAVFTTATAPFFVKETLKAEGVVGEPDCGDIVVITSGNPNDADNTISTSMGNPGCGNNPQGYGTYDCVDLLGYNPSENSAVLAISSEWQEYAGSQYTDWMRIGGITSVTIDTWGVPHWIYTVHPTNSGSRNLATIAAGQAVDLRVADSGDSILDTALIVVPLDCFEDIEPPVLCGNGIKEPGEECDDGNTQNGDGCSELCLIEVPTIPEDAWCCVKQEDGKLPYKFHFMEDSVHDLEFYCKDHLGNTAPVDKEYFKVDTIPPAVKFDFNGAHFIKDGADYIDTASWITLESKDGGPICAVGGDEIYWQNLVYQPIGKPPIDYCANADACAQWSPNNLDPAKWNLYKEPIYKSEESCHVLAYYAQDALGNKGEIEWKCFYVDKQPPITTKTYGKPFFTDGKSDWITSATLITLEATDPMPHPSGVKETKYRVTLLAGDKACLDVDTCNALDGTVDFKTYTDPFTIPEESCHLIEYYSVDNVGKTEVTKKQCVFVDNSAPTVDKTISDPKEHWAGDNTFYPGLTDRCWSTDPAKFIECWKITMGNTLNIDCKDPHPHPVDHNKMCFQLELDGTAPEDDRTEKYCNFYKGEFKDDWCCIQGGIQNFQFLEESQHDLKVKCVDALGNAGPVDEEKFKVEGCAYELCLYKKWNLISVPFNLLNDDPEAVFKDAKDDIASVWTYDYDGWSTWVPGVGGTLEHIKPGYGYWVLAKNDNCFDIAGSLFSPLEVPNSRGLQSGWNLIGYYGNTMMLDGIKTFEVVDGKCSIPSKPVYCALNSLVDTQQGFPRWSSLWNYFNIGNDDAGWYGLDACVDGIWTSYMNPGKGYWIEMDVKDSYAPATNCIWNEDMSCVMPVIFA